MISEWSGSNPRFFKRPLSRKEKYEADAILFYLEDKQTKLEYHSRPLYVMVFFNEVKLRLALVNQGLL